MFAFLSIAITIYFGMHYYVYTRIANGLSLAGIPRIVLLSVFYFGALSFFAVEIISRYTDSMLLCPYSYFGEIWVGMITMALSIFVIQDISRIFIHGQLFRYYSTIAALVLLFVSGGYSVYNATSILETKEIKINTPKLPQNLSGFSIVQLSDIHINSFTSSKWLQNIVDKANGLNPDIIVLTGDLLDADITKFDDFCGILKKLRSKYGVYAVSGNHEMYMGMNLFYKAAKETGFTIIDNKEVLIEDNIRLAGVGYNGDRDGKISESALKEIISGNPDNANKPLVLLSHYPNNFDIASKLGVDLQLSGHTHAGQIPPMDLIIYFVFKYPWGLYQKGSSYIYTTVGSGFWGPPMRLFSRSEVVKFTLINQ
jgi:hypothetical protein